MFDNGMFYISYSDVSLELERVRKEIEDLDEDTLIEEAVELTFHYDGQTKKDLDALIFKNRYGTLLTEDEIEYLKSAIVLHHTKCVPCDLSEDEILELVEIEDYDDE